MGNNTLQTCVNDIAFPASSLTSLSESPSRVKLLVSKPSICKWAWGPRMQASSPKRTSLEEVTRVPRIMFGGILGGPGRVRFAAYLAQFKVALEPPRHAVVLAVEETPSWDAAVATKVPKTKSWRPGKTSTRAWRSWRAADSHAHGSVCCKASGPWQLHGGGGWSHERPAARVPPADLVSWISMWAVRCGNLEEGSLEIARPVRPDAVAYYGILVWPQQGTYEETNYNFGRLCWQSCSHEDMLLRHQPLLYISGPVVLNLCLHWLPSIMLLNNMIFSPAFLTASGLQPRTFSRMKYVGPCSRRFARAIVNITMLLLSESHGSFSNLLENLTETKLQRPERRTQKGHRSCIIRYHRSFAPARADIN